MSKRLTQKEVIEKFKNIHGDRYDYSLVEYISIKSKVLIICKNNHIFDQTPDNHLKGKGCKYCFGLITKKDKKEFIMDSIKVHGNKYNYNMVNYIRNSIKVEIICNKHGIFKQSPNSHLRGNGCKKCYHESLIKNRSDVINDFYKIHGNLYDYSKVAYLNSKKDIIIICKIHGDFKITSSEHLQGSGCKKCMISKFTKKTEDFISQSKSIFGQLYTYDKTKYIGCFDKLILTCYKHGDFLVSPDAHLSKKQGCQKCSNNVSKMELKWIKSFNNSDIEQQYNITIDNKKYKFDGYDLKENTIYEFYGDYWHGNPKVYKSDEINKKCNISFGDLYKKTIEKENKLKSLGYNFISIWESDYKNNLKI
jgi:hypothetical protein